MNVVITAAIIGGELGVILAFILLIPQIKAWRERKRHE
jgi:hypothetical protein